VTSADGTPIHVHVRLFAMQRELAGTRTLDLDLPPGATVDDAWAGLVERYPVLAPGRPAVRFAVNGGYMPAETRLADGDEVAMIPPVSGGGDAADIGREGQARILELRSVPFGGSILAELGARLATPEDGAVVGFLGVTRRSPGTPAPGQETEAARHTGRVVQALTYETHPQMALAILAEIADEIEQRYGVSRLAIVHREGDVPLGEASVAIVACAPHREAAFNAARYAIDETKARAPIWKAERFRDGHVWIGEPARTAAEEPAR
jgi:molybdopterin converting factor subunit 1